ncbi:catalase [Terrabacter sp. NPDC000476]|uniref:catalase n=1 Tax=Terrabacter sp. NPDC000476 TaxID=3154258 RepID=UPI003327A2D0
MEEPRTPPTVAEPEVAHEPFPPQPDQAAPEVVTATGKPTGAPGTARAQSGAFLTTSTGARLRDTDHSLKAGDRGPTLLQDHHLREKITHFDHERIPERVVHARGTGAHGVFRSYGTAAGVTAAGFLADGVETPVFVRFSTVLGSRGSADTVRDTRGFAVKFYTDEGTFDLVGNNIPVFFIQDGIKFPDVVHAAKPHPDREIPQAQSAHDTFWDFVSLHTEAQHHTMWNMSDRGIQASYRTMEGFGVHTFRLVDDDGGTTLVKFHWKPKAGVHSLVWEEAQLAAGGDPDFHRRDLADAIEAGHLPEWELGIQTFPDTPEQTFEGIDLLDPTKLVPEELAPVQAIGLLTLTANPTNFFAETEQVAFHVGNLVRGIDVTNDPLLQARLFSYVDTQLTRLGGPNFNQIPVNRAQAPVNDMLRDGYHQHAVHSGVAPYRPNSLDGGCPFHAGAQDRPFVEVPAVVEESTKVRAQARSFDDHYTQTRLFYRSMSAVEMDHIKGAYAFELAKCYEQAVKERQLQCLANIDEDLCAAVSDALGLPAPDPTIALEDVEPSAALSQVGRPFPAEGRKVGVVVDSRTDPGAAAAVVAGIEAFSMVPFLIAPRGGTVGELPVDRTYATCRSFEYDALVVLGAAVGDDAVAGLDARAGQPTTADATDRAGAAGASTDPRIVVVAAEMWRHSKTLAAFGDLGAAALGAAGIPTDGAGVVTGAEAADPADVLGDVTELLTLHRVWERFAPASA